MLKLTLALWLASAGVHVYALVAVCQDDLLLCRVEAPLRFETWPECEAYLATVRGRWMPDIVIMGKCKSWVAPFDWREE